MRKSFRRIVAILLALLACTAIFTACGNQTPKLTEAAIRSELVNSKGTLDGTLTIVGGTSDDVSAFEYKVTNINASDLKNKSYTKRAVETMLDNPGKITYGQLQVCNGFNAVQDVIGIFYEDENFNANVFIDEALSVICDGAKKV